MGNPLALQHSKKGGFIWKYHMCGVVKPLSLLQSIEVISIKYENDEVHMFMDRLNKTTKNGKIQFDFRAKLNVFHIFIWL